uniref:Uncharacterized protein n=1 Tax=Siphoviridae sp. ctwQY3 TaxID=2826515 RepID=A0A8S5LUD8_9CAUD|nr:MAG TPA: hypothetical protein [Siphoviridae sp. ctwQY3]
MILKDKTLCDFLLSKHLLSILKSSVTFHTFNYLFLKFIILFLKTMLFFSLELDISYILSDSHQLLKACKINE